MKLVQLKLRVPLELRQALEIVAKINGRSANMEAAYRLTQSLIGKPRYRVKMNRLACHA